MEFAKSKIRVLIVDDDSDWVKLITFNINRIEDDITIIGAANTAVEAIESVKMLCPDVILLDLNLSENRYDGIPLAQEILQSCEVKIIILTSFFDENLVKEAFAAGAVNYLSKSEIKRVPDAIRAMYHSVPVIEILARDYKKVVQNEKKNKILDVLNRYEKEVVEFYLQYKSKREVASVLKKSEDTVKNQLDSCYKKLQVRSKKELLEKFSFLSK